MTPTVKSYPDYEYVKNAPETWRRHQVPGIPSGFTQDLINIAGLNRHNKPNLRVVWGGTEKSDKTYEGHYLKYSCGFTPMEVSGYRYTKDGEEHFSANIDGLDPKIFVSPDMQREELGLLRFVIEKWISPEELEAQHRFTKRYAEGDFDPSLRVFPREGVYDTYLIVESLDGAFRRLDKDVVNYLRMQWRYDQKSEKEKESDRVKNENQLALEKAKRQEEIWGAAMNFDLKLDKEEIERREHYWATKTDWAADAQRFSNHQI